MDSFSGGVVLSLNNNSLYFDSTYVPGTVLNAGSSTRLNKGPTFRCCCSEQPKAHQNPRTSAGGNRCEETGSAAGYEEGVGTERVPEEPPG